MSGPAGRAGVLFVLCVGLLLGSCEDESTPDPPGSACIPPCAANQKCIGGRCFDPTSMMPATGRPVGSACATAMECNDGVCLSAASLPDGYCSKVCGGNVVSMGTSCPQGALCAQVSEAAAACLDVCGGASGECRTGYVCAPAGGQAVCVPRCKSDMDCSQATGCNLTSGLCEAGARQPGLIGAPCNADNQCAAGARCVTEAASNGVYPGGYCTRTCSAAEENKPCAGNDGVCVGLTDSAGAKGYICFRGCTTGVDCKRNEYVCSADATRLIDGDLGVCVPRCEHLQCSPGYSCDATVGLCTEGGMMSSTATVERVDLGAVTVGPQTGEFSPVSVNVPSGAVSFALVASPSAPQSTLVVPVKVTAPNGQVVFDYFDPLKTDFKQTTFLNGPVGSLFPNSPRLTLVPGKYDFLIGAKPRATVKVDVLFKKQSGVPKGGTLPLVFWFTKQNYLNAQTAQTNANFQQVLAIFGQIYGAAGITLGPFTYLDIPGPAAQTYAVVDDLEKMSGLFATADSSDLKALHFFMIDQFSLDGGGTLLGLSGGIPGPPSYPGIAHGGVAVALAFLDKNVGVFAETMAHEGGHYLGLYHLGERDGLSFDPLLDTPECGIANDKNNDKLVDGDECAGKGADNLMFWGTARVPQRTLTNDQRFVLLRNPSVQ
jgi:hypothetical protein